MDFVLTGNYLDIVAIDNIIINEILPVAINNHLEDVLQEDLEIVAFYQYWGTTARGYADVIADEAVTRDITVAIKGGDKVAVYFGSSRLAYIIDLTESSQRMIYEESVRDQIFPSAWEFEKMKDFE